MVCNTTHTLNYCYTVMFNVEEETKRKERGHVFNYCNTFIYMFRKVEKMKKP